MGGREGLDGGGGKSSWHSRGSNTRGVGGGGEKQ